jgi:signal transduction histidine kinase
LAYELRDPLATILLALDLYSGYCDPAAREDWLTVSLPTEPVFLVADLRRWEQVLMNVLANAAKFTDPSGDIRLTAVVEAGDRTVRERQEGSRLQQRHGGLEP